MRSIVQHETCVWLGNATYIVLPGHCCADVFLLDDSNMSANAFLLQISAGLQSVSRKTAVGEQHSFKCLKFFQVIRMSSLEMPIGNQGRSSTGTMSTKLYYGVFTAIMCMLFIKGGGVL